MQIDETLYDRRRAAVTIVEVFISCSSLLYAIGLTASLAARLLVSWA